MNNINKVMKVNRPTTLLTILSIILIALISMLFINACENTAPIESPADQLSEIDLQNAADMEEVLRTLAMALPGIMEDEELSEVIYKEVNINIEDEAYSLWSEIANKSTSSGKTLRKALDTQLTNSLGKVRGFTITTESFDLNNLLQVYIHNFNKWNGKDQLPVTYEPLTINDLDVTELEVFEPNGKSYMMDVSKKDWEPDFPIAIVGLNESLPNDYIVNNVIGKPSSTMDTDGIYWDKIWVKKVRHLEPWHKGKAEMVVTPSTDGCRSIEASVRNSGSSATSCSIAQEGRPALVNGMGRGDSEITVSSHNVLIDVYEKDYGNGCCDEEIINGGALYVNSYGGETLVVSTDEEGDYYRCGSYTWVIRCSYNFNWGTTDTELSCLD